jgi:hypothetical protein
MPTLTFPSGREYNKEGSDFTQEEVNQIAAYDASIGGEAPATEAPQDGPSAGQIAGGIAADVGISLAGQAAGAGLAPFTFGVSYPVLAFTSGAAGSYTAQKIEGVDDVSVGRMIVGGLANMLPASKAVTTAGKIASSTARGAGIGLVDEAAYTLIDKKEPATPEEAANEKSFAERAAPKVFFGGLGGTLFQGTFEGGKKIISAIRNKAGSVNVPTPTATTSAANTNLAEVIDESLGIGRPQLYYSKPAEQSAKDLLESTAERAKREQDFIIAKAEEAVADVKATALAGPEEVVLGDNPAKNALTILETRRGNSAKERARIAAKLAAETPKVDDGEVTAQLSPQAQRMLDEYGRINLSALAPLSTGAAGFAVGLSQGDTPEERIKNAAIYGSIAAGATYGGQKLLSGVIDEAIKTGKILPSDFLPKTNNSAANAAANAMVDSAARQVVVADEAASRNLLQVPASSFLSSFYNTAKSVVAPSSVLGSRIRNVIESSREEVNGAKMLGDRVNREVDSYLKKRFGFNGSTFRDEKGKLEAEDMINKFLDRDKSIDKLPPQFDEIVPFLEIAREKIEDLQVKLYKNIDVGYTTFGGSSAGKKLTGIKDKIEESMNKGNYLTREFQWFTNARYNPSAEKRAAAIAEYGDGAEDFLNHLWSIKRAANSDVNQMPTALDGILRAKKDLGPAMLDYLGEIRDPAERLRGTIDRLARKVYRDETNGIIRDTLKANGLAIDVGQEGFGQLKIMGNAGQGQPLFVQPHVQAALDSVYNGWAGKTDANPVINGFYDFFNSGLALAKATKVLGNVSSYLINGYSNIVNLSALGINSLDNAGYGLRVALSQFGSIGTKEFRQRLIQEGSEAARYGLTEGTIGTSEIRDSLSRVNDGFFTKSASKILEPLGRIYSAPDVATRAIVWVANQGVNRKIFPTANTEAIKRFSADVTKDTFSYYNRLSRPLREASRVGVLGQYVSFTAEFIRNQYNQGRIIKEMMNGTYGKNYFELGDANVAAMREEGVRRMTSLLAVYGITAAGVTAATSAGLRPFTKNSGNEKEVEKALRETAIPDYNAYDPLVIKLSEDGKKVNYFNPNYISPYALGISAFNAGISDKPLESVAGFVKNQFGGEGAFFSNALISAIKGVDLDTGQKISNESVGYKNALDRVQFAIEKSFTPPVVNEYTKFQQAKEGKGTLTQNDVLLRQLGVRVNSFTVADSATRKLKILSENAKQSLGDYYSLLERKDLRGGISNTEVAQQYKKQNSSFKDAINIAIGHAKNLQTLRFSEAEIIDVMKKSGFGSSQIISILNDNAPDIPRVRPSSVTDIYEEQVQSLPKEQRAARIKQIGYGNPELIKSLVMKDKSYQIAERKGITSKDDLLMSLDVSDMSRAKQIVRDASRFENRDIYYQAMARKGIVTKEVYRQIKMIEQSGGL